MIRKKGSVLQSDIDRLSIVAVRPLATGELQYLNNDNTSFISNSNAQMLDENINEEYDHYDDDNNYRVVDKDTRI